MKNRGLVVLAHIFMALVWVFLVLYPRPEALFLSLQRLDEPPLNTGAVAHLDPLVEDKSPQEIENLVHTMLPYAPNWETHGMPWYYPTTGEVLESHTADCKGRFVLLASIFERHDIPYEGRISPVHVWITYEEKTETALENEQAHFLAQDRERRRVLQVPEVNWQEFWHHFRTSFLVPLPYSRALLLYLAPVVARLAFLAWEKAWKLWDPRWKQPTAVPPRAFAGGALILRPQQT